MPPETGLISTSIHQMLMSRIRRTHQLRGVGVFVGPPGIGKSTALDALQAEDPAEYNVIVTPHGGEKGVTPRVALQLAIEGLERMCGAWRTRERIPTDTLELRNRLFAVICAWAGLDPYEVRRDGLSAEHFAPLTFAFDEAQNLSRDALEVLRCLNEARAGFSPLPIGLVLMGNDEFALKAGRGGQSPVSAAFTNRARYYETLTYDHVEDEDLRLFFEARGIVEEAALDVILRHIRAGRRDRSLRRAGFLADEILAEADGRAVTTAIVKSVLY